MTEQGKIREVVANSALVMVSLGICLLLIEVTFRLIDGVPLLSAENFIARRIDLVRVNAGPAQFDPILGWRLAEFFAPPINTTSLTLADDGIRMNGDLPRAIPMQAIIAVGSSSTYGTAVSNDETWPARLEALLDEAVVNAGAEDWGMDQIVLRAEALKRKYQPKTLIIAISDRDVPLNGMTTYRGAHKPYFVFERGALALRDPLPGEAPQCLVSSGQNPSVLAYFLVRRMALLKQDGTRLLLVLVYERDSIRVSRRPPSMSIIAAAARDLGVEFIDTFEDVRAEFFGGPTDRRIWGEPATDTQPCSFAVRPWLAPFGNRLLAETLATKAFGRTLPVTREQMQ